MSAPVADPSQFVGVPPDRALLERDGANLPEHERFVGTLREHPARRAIVAAGTTLTAISLIGGIALVAVGMITALASGATALKVAAIAVGALLVATHWGWVHVAEWLGNSLNENANSELRARQQAWLATLEPYSRWSVTTRVLDDGSIQVERVHHHPIETGDGTFTFASDPVLVEVHDPDESSAHVVERAESLRHDAATDTAEQHERWRIASDAYTAALASNADDAEHRAAQIAASKALSEQINTRLREPPLTE